MICPRIKRAFTRNCCWLNSTSTVKKHPTSDKALHNSLHILLINQIKTTITHNVMDFLIPELWLLLPLAFLAGLIDSAVGGGGLIQLPGIFTILPNQPAPMLHGTNKLSSFCGTAIATRQYARRVPFHWNMLSGAILMAFIFANLGARLIPLLPIQYLRPIMLVLMAVVIVLTFLQFRYVEKKVQY